MLTIGEFSRATQLSVKTLRHYHEVGLLEPEFVNPGNGYRHYTEAQIPVAQVIRRLRALEMPVADVKAVVEAGTDRRNDLIAAHLDRLEHDLERTREAVTSLRRLITPPDTPLAVEHRTVAPTPAIAIQAVVDRQDILAWWRGARGELEAILEAQRLRRAGPDGGLYGGALFEHERGEATVFIPVDGAARPIGRVEPVTIPHAELAVVTHHGPLTDIDVTYGELGGYVAAHELGVDGPLRETYLSDSATEIGWPIFRAD